MENPENIKKAVGHAYKLLKEGAENSISEKDLKAAKELLLKNNVPEDSVEHLVRGAALKRKIEQTIRSN